MRGINFRTFYVALFCFGCFGYSYGQSARVQNPPVSLQVLYEADQICAPVAQAIRVVHSAHPKDVYLSDHREAFLAASMFSKPRYIRGNESSLPQFSTGETRFLRTAGPSESGRLIAVEDTALGSHGDFVTSVWISKPGNRFVVRRGSQNYGEQDLVAPDPDSIDLVVDFQNTIGWRSFNYPIATLPSGRINFENAVPPTSRTVDAVKELFSGYVAQEPFLKNGVLYFIAGAPLNGWFLIYRIDTDANAHIECFARWE